MITPGSRLGPYEVVARIGAGGMGEVFKARDTRLERHVAIKVLSADFANDAALRLRFEREAKTISQLSHPNICTLFDVGDNYLVMELLEGETLADRIARGPLPFDQIVKIGSEIATALAVAHKAGVVHRDLKPSNVMLTKSGAKLLDFGLARPESSGLGPPASSFVETIHKPLTQEGALLGTFQYMAPEQLEAGAVDARTDIFALGGVLYEMATGRTAFSGKSKASLIAAILAAEPQPVTALQPSAPVAFDRLVRTCLAKDPDDRWQNARDVAMELRAIAAAPAPSAGEPRRHMTRAVIAFLALSTLVLASLFAWRATRVEPRPVVRSTLLPPDKLEFSFTGNAAPPAVSPDGRRIVFGAAAAGTPRTLWVRSLDSLKAQPVQGTDGGSYPFWSPDGRYIAFFAGGLLKKVESSGGAPVTICEVPDARGGSWSPDGSTIVIAGRYTGIMRVPASGGTPVDVTKLDERFATHRFPKFLPDGKHFLFLASPGGEDDAQNSVCAGSIDGGPVKLLFRSSTEPHYVDGAILFTRAGVLLAQPFDLRTMSTGGEAVPLNEEKVRTTAFLSRSVLSAAAGTLVYQVSGPAPNTRLTWFDRQGNPLGNVGPEAPYADARLSPDGTTAAVSYVAAPQTNIATINLQNGQRTRVTFGDAMENNAVWSPEGGRLLYSAVSAGSGRSVRLRVKDLVTGADEKIFETANAPLITPWSWSSDGKTIFYSIYATSGKTTRSDIYWMSLADRKPQAYLLTQAIETAAQISPDGKWLAYASDESGVSEVYVAPFPPTGAKWQVSTNGGITPRWRADGRELLFVEASRMRIWSVPVVLGSSPQIGAATDSGITLGASGYDVTRDGKRILATTAAGNAEPASPLVLVQNFDEQLRALLAK
jgi:Tol biopolymer transport system component